MSKLVRDAELYIAKSTERALRVVAAEMLNGEVMPADALADQIIREQLELRFPGLFEMIEECNSAYSATALENKQRVEDWKETRKAKP